MIPKSRRWRHPLAAGRLSADVCYGHANAVRLTRVELDLPPGARLAVTGASGSGKTTLLMTLAGLVPPLDGRVLLDGTDVNRFDEDELHGTVSFFAEDAHVFATTVRDNLLVARGDCQDDELTAALDAVGLGGWLASLPEGLSTVLTGGAQALSAGQRRRLLLARAVISPARIVLLDEPTEHLDATDAERVLCDLLGPKSQADVRGADRRGRYSPLTEGHALSRTAHRSGGITRPKGGPKTGVDDDRYERCARKNSRMSAVRTTGSSMAAKWPPWSMSVQRVMVFCPSA